MSGRFFFQSFTLPAGWILVCLTSPLAAETPRCGHHGGVADCDSASQRLICKDGALDMRFPCTISAPGKKSAKPPSARELKFKRSTTHGQIRSPGEPPPVSTIEESKKDLTP